MIRDLIRKNRTCRRFRQDYQISRDTLRDLVDLARLSASAGNIQPLKYVLSCDPEKNARIFPHLAWAGYFDDWPGPPEGERPSAYIIMLGDTTLHKSFDCDAGIAAQSIMLGASEKGLAGWKRKARYGRAENPETFVPNAEPLGNVTTGNWGYDPHSGTKLYGWSFFGNEDPTWKEGREDWKQEIIYQTINVEKGKDYVFTAWILTGDRGSGWGRDSRLRIGVDQEGKGLLEDFDTIDQANVTQWFATHHQWLKVPLHFKAKNDKVAIGIHFLQWWALEANHFYVDEISVVPAK